MDVEAKRNSRIGNAMNYLELPRELSCGTAHGEASNQETAQELGACCLAPLDGLMASIATRLGFGVAKI